MATLARPGCILRRIPGTGFSPVPCTARHRAELHQLCLTVYCWLGIARLGLRQGRFPNFLLDALSTSQAKSGHCSRPQRPPACGLTVRRSLTHTGQCRRVGDVCKTATACPVQLHQQKHGCVKVCGFFWAGLSSVWRLEPVSSPAKSLRHGGTK